MFAIGPCFTREANAVRYNQPIDRWMKNRLLGAFHKQAMSDESQNALRACPLGGLRGAGQGGARAYQVIDNKGRFALHISDEEIARDDARAAVLLGKALPTGRLSASSSVCRNNSARFAPPVSGETTQRSLGASDLTCSTKIGAAVIVTERQRNAFSKAGGL